MNPRNVNTGINVAALHALGILFAFAPLGIWSQAVPDKKADTILVSDGTRVHLVLLDDLQGKQLRVKQTVHFKAREGVVVESKLIVRMGAEAVGHIESVSKNGLFGKSGKLVLQFDYVESTAGAKIPLRGGTGVSGGTGGALTWASAMWYGPDANLPVGTVINAFVNQDQQIQAP